MQPRKLTVQKRTSAAFDPEIIDIAFKVSAASVKCAQNKLIPKEVARNKLSSKVLADHPSPAEPASFQLCPIPPFRHRHRSRQRVPNRAGLFSGY